MAITNYTDKQQYRWASPNDVKKPDEQAAVFREDDLKKKPKRK